MTGLLTGGSGAGADLRRAWRTAGGDLFRVVGQRFDAIANARPASAAAPRAALADIRCVLKAGRRLVITARLTVQPLGAHDAVFELPVESRLVQALVDDRPVACVTE